MSRYKKTPYQKLLTRVNGLTKYSTEFTDIDRQVHIHGKKLFKYSERSIVYNGVYYFPNRADPYVDKDFSIKIPLTHENLKIISTNVYNPPIAFKYIYQIFQDKIDNKQVVLGADEDKISARKIYLTKRTFDYIKKVNQEESISRRNRVATRVNPYLKSEFNFETGISSGKRDYGVLLDELLASGELGQVDLLKIINRFDSGDSSRVIIEKQISKQVKWLIDKMEEIISTVPLTKPKAKDFGKSIFGYNKIDVKGPEQLLEKVLSDYGQYTLFGVPALLNTDKYVINRTGLSRSQFDLILINHLGEIEVVELKRSDEYILDYDRSRGKFFASKSLSVAVSQSERYLSAVYKENDDNYSIKGQKLKDFIISQVGESIYVESVRPTALILIGSYYTICKPYSELSESIKNKVNKENYDRNSLQAYRELKDTFKRIKIMTYSELLENARTRLYLQEEE